MLQTAKERRNRFADLKVNWPVLGLNDDIVVEFAIERMECIVCSFRPVALGILPVAMMVIHKRSIENDATMGFERARNHIGSIYTRPPVDGRPGPPFAAPFDSKPANPSNPSIDH